jgi:hypothetical protein
MKCCGELPHCLPLKKTWILFFLNSTPMFLWLHLLECNMSRLSKWPLSNTQHKLTCAWCLFCRWGAWTSRAPWEVKQSVLGALPFPDCVYQFLPFARADRSACFRLCSCFLFICYMPNMNNVVYMWIMVPANRSALIQFKIFSGVLIFLHSHYSGPFVIYVILPTSPELIGGIMCEY